MFSEKGLLKYKCLFTHVRQLLNIFEQDSKGTTIALIKYWMYSQL